MHINVDNKPITPNTYDSKKKRLIETIDRLYHRDARGPLQKMLARIHPADLAAILDELPVAALKFELLDLKTKNAIIVWWRVAPFTGWFSCVLLQDMGMLRANGTMCFHLLCVPEL